MSRWWLGWLLLLAGCPSSSGAPGEPAPSATATPTPSLSAGAPPLSPCPALDRGITGETLRRHLDNLTQVAKQYGGDRSRASGGFDASVAYVMHELEAAGLAPRRDAFDVPASSVLGPGALAVTSPTRRAFLPGRRRLTAGEFTPLRGSPPGDVTAEIAAVGVSLGPGNRSASGCTLDAFGDGAKSRVAGKIALMQRGTCPFAEKVRNAETAGAVAALVFNQGDAPDRRGLLGGGLDGRGVDHGITIPALFVTAGVGEQLLAMLARSPVEVHLAADTAHRVDRVHNVVLDVPGERGGEVLIVGAHLDSVDEGPGMNDNASGVAAVLEIARQLGGCASRRGIRLAFWGAEEEGLLGSTAYVSSLTSEQIAAARGYINLDMLAAPNHAFMLTDGDGSQFAPAAPGTSGELEAFFRDDFATREEPLLEVRYVSRSDDKPFYDAGIGVVMLGAGYDGVKNAKEAALFGGSAGKRYDPCYHRACDDMKNVNLDALTVITHAVARAVHHFGVRGEGLTRAGRASRGGWP